MILHDTTVYLYRCDRCAAAFVLTGEGMKVADTAQWDLLVHNLCQTCHKGRIEYLGEVGVMTRDASAPTR